MARSAAVNWLPSRWDRREPGRRPTSPYELDSAEDNLEEQLLNFAAAVVLAPSASGS